MTTRTTVKKPNSSATRLTPVIYVAMSVAGEVGTHAYRRKADAAVAVAELRRTRPGLGWRTVVFPVHPTPDTPTTIHHLAIDTRSWSFDAYGSTPAEAVAAMRQGWAEHVRQTDASPDLIDELLADHEPRAVRLGGCYRDDDALLD